MMMRRLLAAIVFMLAGTGLTGKGALAAPCQMLQIGELPVTFQGRQGTVEVLINGQPVEMLIDSGSEATLLFRSSAERLGLALKPLGAVKFYGVGGGDAAAAARINELKLANMTVHNFDVIVTGRQSKMGRAEGLLGAGFLLQADVEFDYPEGKLRFFKPKDCAGDQVIYWGKAYSVTPLIAQNAGDKIEVMVSLNGAPVLAAMDTGASTSVVTTAAADRAGVKPTSDGVTAAGQSTGLGSQAVETYLGVFPTFSFGDETIKNAKLRIADLFKADKEVELGSHIPTQVIHAPQMLLGADFFRSHRVYVAKSQGKVYVSYVGGPVFETRRSVEKGAPTAAQPATP
jgi:predicted aspartyl protease